MPDGIGGTVKRTAGRIVKEGIDVESFDSFMQVLENNLRNMNISVTAETEMIKMRTIVYMKQEICLR